MKIPIDSQNTDALTLPTELPFFGVEKLSHSYKSPKNKFPRLAQSAQITAFEQVFDQQSTNAAPMELGLFFTNHCFTIR